MKKALTFFIFIFVIKFCFSQYNQLLFSDQLTGQTITLSNTENSVFENVNSKEQYLNENFVLGTIKFQEENISQANLLRYNVVNDVFEVKTDKGQMIIKQSEKIDIILEDAHYYYLNNTNSKGYHQLIKDFGNENKLFLKVKKIYKEAKKATTPYSLDTPATFTEVKTILYADNQGNVKAIKNNKKRVLNFFPEEARTTIKKYIKKQKLTFKGDDYSSIIKLIEKYSSSL